MNKRLAAFAGTVRRIVLRILAWWAYDTYVRAETILTRDKAAHRESTERLAKSLRRVKELRGIHERFRDRLEQNVDLNLFGELYSTSRNRFQVHCWCVFGFGHTV
jgi:hypothetical protein